MATAGDGNVSFAGVHQLPDSDNDGPLVLWFNQTWNSLLDRIGRVGRIRGDVASSERYLIVTRATWA